MCKLCPRKCNTDRSEKFGFCNKSKEIEVARSGVHLWEEPVISGIPESEEKNTKKRVPASIAFVPSVAGLIMAGEVVKDLVSQK